MTYNRMGELRDIVPEIRTGNKHLEDDSSFDMSDFLRDYTKKMDAIELEFSDLKSKFQKIKEINTKMLQSTNAKEKKDHKDELKKWTTSVSKKNKEISKSLSVIGEENEQKRRDLGDDESSAEMRIRITQHMTVTNKFKDLIGEYQEMQEKFKRENAEKQKRSMKIANPKLSEDEVETIVSSGIDEDAYKKKLGITKSQKGSINAYFDDAVESRKDVQQIEASLIELQDLFISMAQLVAQQSELLDNIEVSVGMGEEVTRKGLEHVQATKQHQERSRVVTVVIALIIIIFVIIAILIASGVTGGVLYAILKSA